MQRVEPADVRPYVEPPLRGPAPLQAQVPESPLSAPELKGQHAAGAERAPAAPRDEEKGSIAFLAAMIFSLLWVGALAAYGVGLVGLEKLVALPLEWHLVIGAVTVIPVALACFSAVVMSEAHNLRRQSLALARSAENLLSPEDQAARNLARLSRAIKRELDVFNSALETAASRMASVESTANERLALIERTAAAAQERVEKATNKLGSEREKLAQFTQALDSVVLAASETLTTRLQDARAAARSASESLHAEHGAIAGLISTLQSASHAVSSKAMETSKEIERQTQRLDAASEAAAARSEQVVARHERQRMAFAETIERLKQENDHMARALDYQREGMNKLVQAMAEENKKIGTFTVESARRLDDAASAMAQRIVETTQLFSREAEKLRTSTELTTSGLEQAMQTIRSAGDNSFDAAGRLGSVLVGLRDTATSASQQIEGTVGRLSKLLNDMPTEAANHVKLLRNMIDEQSQSMRDLNAKVSAAFDRVQGIELTRTPAPLQLESPQHQQPMQAPQRAPAPPPAYHSHAHMNPPPVHSMPAQPQYAPPPPPAAEYQSPAANFGPKSYSGQPGRELPAPPARPAVAPPHRQAPSLEQGIPNFNVPPPGPQMGSAGYPQNKASGPLPQDRASPQGEAPESRGWFGLAKRFVRNPAEEAEPAQDDRSNWDMKSLLAAIETKDTGDRRPSAPSAQGLPHFRGDPNEIQQIEQLGNGDMPAHRHVQPQQAAPQMPPRQPSVQRMAQPQVQIQPQNGGNGSAQTSSRHMIETLQAMAIDLCRFLEDEPPHDLLKRYRNGERNVFARRLASILGAEHTRVIAHKYNSDREFRDTVDRYIQQFEALLEQTARSDKENVLVETYLTSQTGKVYVTLASAVGRLT